MNRAIKGLVAGAALLLLVSAVAAPASMAGALNLVSKGSFTTEFQGSGFTPNSTVTLEVPVPGNAHFVIGKVTTDANGNFDPNWDNLVGNVKLVQAGVVVTAVQAGMSSPFTTKTDFSLADWVLDLLTSPAAGQNKILMTDLTAAGFLGNVSLLGTSPNATALSSVSGFDVSADTITTNGLYQLNAPGPVFGSYEAAGTFTNLFDPTTGSLVTSPQILAASFQIGTIVVPEPAGVALLVVGLAGLAAAYRAKRG